jgi:hypothetical protein
MALAAGESVAVEFASSGNNWVQADFGSDDLRDPDGREQMA